jgi:hypothetical protein
MTRYFTYLVDNEEELSSIHSRQTLDFSHDPPAELLEGVNNKTALILFSDAVVGVASITDFDGVQMNASIDWTTFYFTPLETVSSEAASNWKLNTERKKIFLLSLSSDAAHELNQTIQRLKVLEWNDLLTKIRDGDKDSLAHDSSPSRSRSPSISRSSSPILNENDDRDDESNEHHNRRRSPSRSRSQHSHNSSRSYQSSERRNDRSRSRDRSQESVRRSETVDSTVSTSQAEVNESEEPVQSKSNSAHNSKSDHSRNRGSRNKRIDFDVTNMTYEQYCAEHYGRAIDSYRKERFEKEMAMYHQHHHMIMAPRGPAPPPPGHGIGYPPHHVPLAHAPPSGYPVHPPHGMYGGAPRGAPVPMMYNPYPHQPPAPPMR